MARSAITLSKQDRAVLSCLKKAGGPKSAYDIINSLGSRAKSPAPTIIYRSLDRLMNLGLVHKVASLRAFVACRHPDAAHRAILSVCMGCHTVDETTVDDGEDTGFSAGASLPDQAEIEQVELQVRCRRCQTAA